MPKLIDKKDLIQDPTWAHLSSDMTLEQLNEASHIKCSLEIWLARKADLNPATKALALLLQGHHEIDPVAQDLNQFSQIHVHFSEFKDGRGYSLARLIRQRFNFKGQLRATGDVTQDQLFYLSRCGFDAFELRDDQDIRQCLSAFCSFTQTYQAAADQPLPIYRRSS